MSESSVGSRASAWKTGRREASLRESRRYRARRAASALQRGLPWRASQRGGELHARLGERQKATERLSEAQQLARNATEEQFFARRAAAPTPAASAALPGD